MRVVLVVLMLSQLWMMVNICRKRNGGTLQRPSYATVETLLQAVVFVTAGLWLTFSLFNIVLIVFGVLELFSLVFYKKLVAPQESVSGEKIKVSVTQESYKGSLILAGTEFLLNLIILISL